MTAITATHNAQWADALVQGLMAPSPRDVVLSPGSRSTPLVLALHALGARMHVVLDERAAAFFALGLARAQGRAVILLCTSGSAATHYFPAVVEASHSRIPLIVLTADRPPELHNCGATQTMSQTRLFGEHVRWFADVGTPHGELSPRYLRTTAAQALDRAEAQTPGPVHLNVPFREPLWQQEVDVEPRRFAAATVVRGVAQLDDVSLTRLAQRLGNARRGVILCGPRTPRAGDDALRASVKGLAAALRWPLLADAASGMRLSGVASPELVSTYDALLRDPAFSEAHAPDVIVQIGQLPTSKPCAQWLARYGVDRTILIDPHGAWSDPSHVADSLVVADIHTLAQALTTRLAGTSHADPAWLSRWQAADKRARAALASACDAGFWEGGIAREVVQALPDGAALHVASSMPIRDVDTFATPTGRSCRIYSNRGLNGIDGTLAAALGTAAAHPGHTALLIGDLAFLHDIGALQLARQSGARLTVVVVNNNGGAIFGFLPIAAHATAFTPYYRTPQDADIEALARAAGARHRRVETRRELRIALDASWTQPDTSIIEAVVDSQDNLARHRAVWQDVARIVSDGSHGEAT